MLHSRRRRRREWSIPVVTKKGKDLGTHDVVASINKENFTSDTTGKAATQEESRITNFALFDIAAQRGNIGSLFAETCKARDTTSGERIQGTSRDSIHTNIVLTKLKCEITNATF